MPSTPAELYATWEHIATVTAKRFLCKNSWIPAHDRNDYEQEARLALWNAVSGDAFDPERASGAVASYLTTRVYGAMYDYLRRTNCTAKHNRSKTKTKYRKASAAIRARGEAVTEATMAAETGLNGDALRSLLKHGTQVTVYQVDVNDVALYDDSVPALALLEDKELREVAEIAIGKLTGQARAIADMLCLGARQEDIASCLGVSAARVSQIKMRTCAKIKAGIDLDL